MLFCLLKTLFSCLAIILRFPHTLQVEKLPTRLILNFIVIKIAQAI
jgi:hypothetical protein